MSHKFMFFLFFLSFFAFSGKEEDQGLFQAAQEGSIEKMAYWIEKGANIHAMDDKRQTPICMLVRYGHTQSACWLLKRYADSYQANPLPGVFELIRPVVQTDNVVLFKLLLAYQLIVVASPLLMQECSLPLRSKAYWNNWRYSLLRQAALAGAVSIVEHIYDHHKEAYSDYCWQAAFRLSVKENHIPIVELLLKKGIDINLQTEPFEKYYTLGLACIRGNLTMVQLLLRYGANPDLKDGHGYSGVDYALHKGHDSIAKYLLRLGQRPAFYIYNDLALRNYFIYHNGSSLECYPSLKAWLHKFLTALRGCWPTFPPRTVLQNALEQVESGISPKCSAAKKALPFELVGPESIWDHYTIFLDWFISLAQFDRESAMHFMNNITTEECFTFVPLSLEEADKELSTDVASLRSHSMRSVAQAVFQSSHVNLLKIKNHTPDTEVDLTYAETFFLDQASRLIPSIFGRSPPMFVRLAETISTISRSIFWASHNQQ